jgi:hypothetical protein
MPDLTGFPALDVAIGMVFLFTLLSALCSGIQEAIASIFNLRAKNLEKALRNFLNDPAKAGEDVEDFAQKIYDHPLVRQLWRDGKTRLRKVEKDASGKAVLAGKKTNERKPSYIPPRTFSLALFDIIAPALDENGKPKPGADVLDDMIASLSGKEGATPVDLPDDLKKGLLTLATEARGSIDKFRRGVENWFDDAMARVSGWYKRQAQLILMVIAIVVTGVLNVDSFLIADTLWKDQPVRAAVVSQAMKAAGKPAPDGKDLEKAADAVNGVKKLNIPMGWPNDKKPKAGEKQRKDPRSFTLRKVPGWLVTWLGLMLGAPFWFDLLKRLVQMRGTGAPENTGSTKPSAGSRRSRSTA